MCINSLESDGYQGTRTTGELKKILRTGATALCGVARHPITDPRLLAEIAGFEEAVQHGEAALALLRRLRKHFADAFPEPATAHAKDAIESFFAELPERE